MEALLPAKFLDGIFDIPYKIEVLNEFALTDNAEKVHQRQGEVAEALYGHNVDQRLRVSRLIHHIQIDLRGVVDEKQIGLAVKRLHISAGQLGISLLEIGPRNDGLRHPRQKLALLRLAAGVENFNILWRLGDELFCFFLSVHLGLLRDHYPD